MVLITFDTARADHFGCYGKTTAHTPNWDRIAGDGLLFEECITPVPLTLPAHATILTGLDPPTHGVRENVKYALGEEWTTLPERLKSVGYQTAAFVSADVLEKRYGLARGFNVYDDQMGSAGSLAVHERVAADTADAAIAWLRTREPGPYFLWVHFFDPHKAYQPPGEWLERFRDDPYSGEIAYADHEMGRVLEEVALDETLVVLTADHGESLWEHGEQTHGFFAYDACLRVPLVIRQPGTESPGARLGVQASLADLFPTILTAVGVTWPSEVDGVDLLHRSEAGFESRAVYFESIFPLTFGWSPISGIRTVQHKYIQAPKPEFYDLKSDPDELNNVFEAHRREAQALSRQLARIDPFGSLGADGAGRTVAPEELRTLSAHGYFAGGRISVADLSSLPDPKDKIEVYRDVMNAQSAYLEGRLAQAAEILGNVLKGDPGLTPARVLYGKVLSDQGEYEAAVDSFEQALPESEGQPDVWHAYVAALNLAGLGERAAELCAQGLERFPEDPVLHNQRGVALRLTGDTEGAIASGQRSIELGGETPARLQNLGHSYVASGSHQKALRLFRKALEIDDAAYGALRGVAFALLNLGEVEEAERAFRAALAVNGDDLVVHLARTTVLLHLQRAEEAAVAAQVILEAHPEHWQATFYLAASHILRGDAESAEQILRDYRRAHPRFPARL